MQARIYQKQLSPTQSGKAASRRWVLEATPNTRAYTDSLMGWSSNKNHLLQTLYFDTLSECKEFAQNENIDFQIIDFQENYSKPKSYSDNFK